MVWLLYRRPLYGPLANTDLVVGMGEWGKGQGGLRSAAFVAVLGAILPGCSTSILTTPASSFSALVAQNSPTVGTTPTDNTLSFECPSVGIREGAATLSVTANQNEDAAINLRYQVGIATTARECRLNGNMVTMKVGVQGRVVLGPAGGPGQIEVPLRLAVVHEGPEPKPIFTKLIRVQVTVPPDSGNVQFTMIEDGITFPMPRAGIIDEYIVYVGFDPHAPAAKKPQRAAPPRRRS
jgi:hypothetical protein